MPRFLEGREVDDGFIPNTQNTNSQTGSTKKSYFYVMIGSVILLTFFFGWKGFIISTIITTLLYFYLNRGTNQEILPTSDMTTPKRKNRPDNVHGMEDLPEDSTPS